MEAEYLDKIIEKAWEDTTKILFKKELYGIESYKEWLLKHVDAPVEREGVHLTHGEYKGTKYKENYEVEWNKPLLGIDEIKDIDSIVEGIKENLYYVGNVVLGNSNFVVKSTGTINSFYVLNSNRVVESKYIAYSSKVKSVSYAFGVNLFAEGEFGIKSYHLGFSRRVFECSFVNDSSDIYYSFALIGCNEAMFSFNVRGKNYVIGNLELERSKYLRIKESLIEQIREEIEKKKEIFSLIDLINYGESDLSKFNEEFGEEEISSKKPIEKAWKTTTKIILKKELEDIDSYKKFLLRHVNGIREVSSPLTEKQMVVQDAIPFSELKNKKIVKEKEGAFLSKKLKLNEEEIESLELGNVLEKVGKIAYAVTELRVFENINLIKTAVGIKSSNCYHGCNYIRNRFCAYSYWPRNSEYTFGSAEAMNSSFCINCYYSGNLTRAFEVDSSSNSSDVYFCHNVDNVHNALFSFNAKNLSYAIANVKLGAEKFNEIKSSLLEQIEEELEKNKWIKLDIMNL